MTHEQTPPAPGASMEELERAATKGPWRRDGARGLPWTVEYDADFDTMRGVCECRPRPWDDSDQRHEEQDYANAAFIAAARTWVPHALARIKRLEEALAGLLLAAHRCGASMPGSPPPGGVMVLCETMAALDRACNEARAALDAKGE